MAVITTLGGMDLPCAVRIAPAEVIHMACDDAPRNLGGVSVACCGERIKEHTEPAGVSEGDPTCPLCAMIPEGKCACFSDVASGSGS